MQVCLSLQTEGGWGESFDWQQGKIFFMDGGMSRNERDCAQLLSLTLKHTDCHSKFAAAGRTLLYFAP